MNDRPTVHKATRRNELAALASPVRLQIVNIMEGKQVWSARQIAGVMGRKPETLYYQLQVLEKCGLIVRAGSRSTRRRDETLYALCAGHIMLDRTRKSAGFLKGLIRTSRAILRLFDRQAVAALLSEQTRRTGKYRNFRLDQYSLRLSNTELIELQRLLDNVECFIRKHDSAESGDRYSVLVGLAGIYDDEAGSR